MDIDNDYDNEMTDEWEDEPVYARRRRRRESAWDEAMRKGVYLSTAAQQGLSFGWADELEGAMAGLGYGLGSLNPDWNTRKESFREAARRGYIEARDRRRRKLEEAYREMPLTTAAVEIGSSMLIPGIKKVPRYSFFNLHDKARKVNAVTTGLAYSAGSSEGAFENQLLRTALGGFGGLSGHRLGNTILNRYTPYPIQRNMINQWAGDTIESTYDYISDSLNK